MQPLAFVDLETTGATAALDRITEIGIVQVDPDGHVREWQQLVNPGQPIPPFIAQLTGIHDAMVADAPPFAAVAAEAFARLEGRLFLAHNARFDYGFLKAEFARAGIVFRAPVRCTVKLSRALYPEFKKHSLDALIERHGLYAEDRHRALADAQLIHQFWQKIHVDRPGEAILAALEEQDPLALLPPELAAACLDELPEAPGRYRLLDAAGQPLHIATVKNLRQRILAHFSPKKASARKRALAARIRAIDWTPDDGVKTAG